MRCFNHQENWAVGLCKSCAKSLCHDCLTDLGGGLACKARCEERVTALIEYSDFAVKQGLRSYKRMDRNNKNSAFFMMSIGAIFLGFAVFQYVDKGFGPIDLVPATLSLFFFLWGGTLLNQKDK
jgi:hypothetical protein